MAAGYRSHITAAGRLFVACFLLLAIRAAIPIVSLAEPTASSAAARFCTGCHEVELDDAHEMSCLTCHRGDPSEFGDPFDHDLIVRRPAHPAEASLSCGSCHQAEIEMVRHNAHYTLQGHVQAVRTAFGGEGSPADALLIESSPSPDSELELVDDLLRRRCLRCHVYYEGDEYAGVRHATGCGACHLKYEDGHLASHRFDKAPGDTACLSCHYGNHVGFDYYGRFEHDYNNEYRTPYRAGAPSPRPYGVEFHQLRQDIHQAAGMVCLDCHKQRQVMGKAPESLTCRDCHDAALLRSSLPVGVRREEDGYTFTSTSGSAPRPLPALSHPAHRQFEGVVTCQGCHAQWVFGDQQTHLLRLDHDDFFELGKLTVDSSSEVERILSSYFADTGEVLDPAMTDKFTGHPVIGIWIKGYGQRRWERLELALDRDGVLTTFRPILDLRLSWVDSDEVVRYDNLRPAPGTKISLPYQPHTIGPAGLFYEERIRRAVEVRSTGGAGPQEPNS